MLFALFIVPASLQAAAMAVDEGWYHRRRGLPRWERIGHPLDTTTVLLAYAWLLLHEPGDTRALVIYAALALFSCVFVTKDELVHAGRCTGGEHWLHAVLFVLHPLVFAAFAALWVAREHLVLLWVQTALTGIFALHQLIYWSLLCKRT